MNNAERIKKVNKIIEANRHRIVELAKGEEADLSWTNNFTEVTHVKVYNAWISIEDFE